MTTTLFELSPWLMLCIMMMLLIGLANTYEKAGLEAYHMFLPWKIAQVAGLPTGTFLILFLPFINILFFIFMAYRIGLRFGMKQQIAAFMCFLPFVLFLLTGLSKRYRYIGLNE